MLPSTLGELRRAVAAGAVSRRSVHAEVRQNLSRKLRAGEQIFPGIIGYDDTVVPQVVNAILSQHNFILLGLRGQAKTRMLRALTSLLDEFLPVVPGSEINDDPLAPLSAYARGRVAEEGDSMPVAWRHRDERYVEKLATPDVTIADMIGDIDPIKAARGGLQLSDEFTMHFGLLPRANRCIFAINELPDLAGKIQVGLFNILQEGDVQIKGYPVRLPLDVMMVFSANPEDYTARGKIITPLKDRIGSEIRTHYPASRQVALAITAQEAWTARDHDHGDTRSASERVDVPGYIREIVEEVAFQARADQKVDKRSGVSQRLPISALENVVSNAERRALLADENPVVPRVTDVYAALPSMTGKFELEYEGELRGATIVAADLVRAAVSNVFNGYVDAAELRPVIDWFEMGGTLQVSDTTSADDLLEQAGPIQGLREAAERLGPAARTSAPALASAIDFILEGLCAQKKISRSDDWKYSATDSPRRPLRPEPSMPEPRISPSGKKKYYN
jgi:magnesium chelatase subunit I